MSLIDDAKDFAKQAGSKVADTRGGDVRMMITERHRPSRFIICLPAFY